MVLVTGRNKVVAKVIFLHLSVILFTGGSLPQCMLGCQPPGADTTPPDYVPPNYVPPRLHTPQDYVPPGLCTPRLHTPQTMYPPDYVPPRTTYPPRLRTPPPGSRLQHTVYERLVRILLECILVFALQFVHGVKEI